jgi:transcriptional regulator with XRE-family HTH domain
MRRPALIPSALRSAREDRDWSQQTLAVKLGITVTTVCRWETGVNVPNLPTLRRVAKALGVTLSTLVEES